jgi:hypothetical protein
MAQYIIDTVRRMVLSQANVEQNGHYPPRVFNEHINLVTQFLLDRGVDIFQQKQQIEDIVRPFHKVEKLVTKNGKISYPESYRNYLVMSVAVSRDGKKYCQDEELSLEGLQMEIAEKDCSRKPVRFMPVDEFDDLSSHVYKKPKYSNPIVKQNANGFVICPPDCGSVEIEFICKPKQYFWGYKMNDDETYSFDPTTTVDVEWEETAIPYLVQGCVSLYSIYVRDGELTNGAELLKRSGIF